MRSRPGIDALAVRWLTDRGVWIAGRPHTENMQRCEQFRAKFARLGAEPGKDWARAIVADYRAGVVLSLYSVRLAMAALGMQEEQLLRTPAKRVPRPDQKDRAAGDVEVAF